METEINLKLTCPICQRPLADEASRLLCSAGHSFDRAREGYVNLLASGHGKSRLEGDTSAMLRARRRTFERGYFQALSDAINTMAGPDDVVLDAGCGEGYYIGRLMRAHLETQCYAFDLSTHALKLAARAYKHVLFFANDVKHRICMADRSVDLLLNIFAPRNPLEFERVLSDRGRLLVVVPGADHLEPLRSRHGLLHIDEDKVDRTVELLQPALELHASTPVLYEVDFASDHIADLIQMTPNYWHTRDSELELQEDAGVPITMSFVLLEFRRTM